MKKTIKIYYDTGGTCYSRIGLPNTKQGQKDAELLSKKIKEYGDCANGGWYHGMPMGNISKFKDAIEVDVCSYPYWDLYNIVKIDSDIHK